MRQLLGSLLFTLTVALTACESPTAPNPLGQLQEARALWEAHVNGSYSFELTRDCFCVLGGRRMTVTVQNGAVTDAEYLDSGSAVDRALLTYLPSIPDLFDLIEDALNRKVASFLVAYDPIYGFPARIEIDYSAQTADDEIAFTVRDLTLSDAMARRP